MTTNHKDYKLIAIWGQMLGSFPGYVNNEQYQAWLEDAPLTAIYKESGTERWVTADEVKSEGTRKELFERLARLAAAKSKK